MKRILLLTCIPVIALVALYGPRLLRICPSHTHVKECIGRNPGNFTEFLRSVRSSYGDIQPTDMYSDPDDTVRVMNGLMEDTKSNLERFQKEGFLGFTWMSANSRENVCHVCEIFCQDLSAQYFGGSHQFLYVLLDKDLRILGWK